jgi:hypothetical protein
MGGLMIQMSSRMDQTKTIKITNIQSTSKSDRGTGLISIITASESYFLRLRIGSSKITSTFALSHQASAERQLGSHHGHTLLSSYQGLLGWMR